MPHDKRDRQTAAANDDTQTADVQPQPTAAGDPTLAEAKQAVDADTLIALLADVDAKVIIAARPDLQAAVLALTPGVTYTVQYSEPDANMKAKNLVARADLNLFGAMSNAVVSGFAIWGDADDKSKMTAQIPGGRFPALTARTFRATVDGEQIVGKSSKGQAEIECLLDAIVGTYRGVLARKGDPFVGKFDLTL